MLAHALDLHELLRRGRQHLVQISEMVQQIVGQIVGVLLGDGEKQQQLQRVELAEMIQPLPQEPLFYPLSVFFMVSHKAPLSTCFFLKKRYNNTDEVENDRTRLPGRKEGPMEQIDQLLALLDRPAFRVEGGRITALNTAAQGLSLEPGAPIGELLATGREAYAEFERGCLTLELALPGGNRCAVITALEQGQLFTLEPEDAHEDLRMLALAAQTLREPLADVMALADELPAGTAHRDELTRGLYRLLRIVGNMTPPAPFSPEMVELNALLREIWDQAMPACEAKGITFTFVPSPAPVFTAADGPLLMRAIHNLLSNSMKFSPGQTLTLELRRKGTRLHILYTDPGAMMPPDPFTRYLRDPGLEDPRLGLGMGLKLVTTAAVAHQGCAFLVPRKTGGVTTVLDLPIRQDTPLRSNRHRISYTGERDALLVELSDVLPPEFYK